MSLLYKYRKFATPEDQKIVLEILKNESFWFARASEVNDPFEFRCAVDFAWDAEQTAQLFAAVERRQKPWLSEEKALEKAKNVISRVSQSKLRERQWELSFKLWHQLARSVTLCCFAGTPESILMWSHYAGSHTGVAIEVEPHGSLEKFTFPVTYSDDIPRIIPLALVDVSLAKKESLFEVLFLRKAKCWEYEREYRAMVFGPDPCARTLPRGSIKRIILGCAATADSRRGLIEWVHANAPHIGVAVAGPSTERSYSLEVADTRDLSS